jgi:predicted RNA-binding Zn-ribbon protein involved in translation (DUF1610 family)
MISLYRGIVFLASLFLLFGAQVSADAVSDLQDKGRAAWNAQLAKSKTCTAANLKVRKEWYVKPQKSPCPNYTNKIFVGQRNCRRSKSIYQSGVMLVQLAFEASSRHG